MTVDSVFDEGLILPKAVENLAKDDPDGTWMRVARDTELKEGWRDITYQELAHAIDGFAAWVEGTIGDAEVVAYMGINDIRYAIAEMGIIKAGRMILLPSPRNSREGQVSLFEDTKCRILLHSEGMETHIQAARAAMPYLQTIQVSSFDDFRDKGSNSAYDGRYGLSEDTKALILHTSGSTGMPKPIYITHGGIATVKGVSELPLLTATGSVQLSFGSGQVKSAFAMAPFFHEGGSTLIARSIFSKVVAILPPAGKPPTAQLIMKIIEQTKPSLAIFFPSMLEQIVELPGGLDALGTLDAISFGGAPLAQDVGDKISRVTFLSSGYGSTEAGIVMIKPKVAEDRQTWNYFQWLPESGVELQPEGDGLFELVIKRMDRKYQKTFHTFPDVDEYRTKDLFEQHPSNPSLWKFTGRKDDVLVLSNGEKLNPIDAEKRLEVHPLVKGALVIGQEKFQTGLLIEPEWDLLPPDIDPAELLETLWPAVEKANEQLPGHGQVWKSKVAIAKRDKPFTRTDTKGNIMRRKTVQLYVPEIEALYSNEALQDQIGTLPPDADLPTMKAFLRSIFTARGFQISDNSSDESDIFATYGVDSLQVLAFASTLNHALGPDRVIRASAVYTHPTISSLAQYLLDADKGHTVVDREQIIASTIKRYTHDLPARTPPTAAARPDKHTVILTGSTGSLGNLVLQELIESSAVAKVYCLNRSVEAETRQHKSFADRGASAVGFSKVAFLHTDFSQNHFGLAPETYDELLQTVDIFIHNAWAVDFNKTLQSYESVHIAGTRRCVDFSLESKYHTHIVFISSIASVSNWLACSHAKGGVIEEVPEMLIEDNNLPSLQGYGESKHAASLILGAAAQTSGVRSTIVRAGQLAGSSNDGNEWNRHEWFPSIIISSKALGMIPSEFGGMSKAINWVPMDLAARSVVEIAKAREGQNNETAALKVAHLINPQTATWDDLLPTVQKSLSQELGSEVPTVPFAEWVRKLKTMPADTKEEVELVPGIKLIEFYEGMAMDPGGPGMRMATAETAKMSKTVSGMQPVNAGLMEKWMEQWQLRK